MKKQRKSVRRARKKTQTESNRLPLSLFRPRPFTCLCQVTSAACSCFLLVLCVLDSFLPVFLSARPWVYDLLPPTEFVSWISRPSFCLSLALGFTVMGFFTKRQQKPLHTMMRSTFFSSISSSLTRAVLLSFDSADCPQLTVGSGFTAVAA